MTINLKGRELVVKVNDKETQKEMLPADAAARGAFGLRDTGAAMDLMNLHVREL